MQKRHLFENEKERIRAINVLAGHQLHLMEAESDPTIRRKHSQKGYKLIEKGNEISQIDEHNLCSMCFYEITAGQLKQAHDYYYHCENQVNEQAKEKARLARRSSYEESSKELSEQSNAIKALMRLARAIIEFAKGHVKESLGFLKQMV